MVSGDAAKATVTCAESFQCVSGSPPAVLETIDQTDDNEPFEIRGVGTGTSRSTEIFTWTPGVAAGMGCEELLGISSPLTWMSSSPVGHATWPPFRSVQVFLNLAPGATRVPSGIVTCSNKQNGLHSKGGSE